MTASDRNHGAIYSAVIAVNGGHSNLCKDVRGCNFCSKEKKYSGRADNRSSWYLDGEALIGIVAVQRPHVWCGMTESGSNRRKL